MGGDLESLLILCGIRYHRSREIAVSIQSRVRHFMSEMLFESLLDVEIQGGFFFSYITLTDGSIYK